MLAVIMSFSVFAEDVFTERTARTAGKRAVSSFEMRSIFKTNLDDTPT